MKDYYSKIFKLKTSQRFILLLMFFLIQSCEEDIAKVSNDKKKTNFASQVIYNGNIIQKDSGQVKVNFRAPLIEKYELIDSPYVEGKKGIYLEFFDKKSKEPGKIWAKYAKYNEKKDFYFAKGRVKIITTEGQTFVTETINWDKRKQQMYTKDTVFVSDKDGNILVGAHGMVAKDDFSEYTFFNNSGSFTSSNLPATSK
jgi:hypothetical protein